MENSKEHTHSAVSAGANVIGPHQARTQTKPTAASHEIKGGAPFAMTPVLTSHENTHVAGDGAHRPAAQADLLHDGHVVRIGTLGVAAFALVFVALLGGLFLLGWRPYRQLQADIMADAAATRDTRPVVAVSIPRKQAQTRRLTLPADLQAYQHTLIFARASGYLKKQYVDIGDRVTAGKLLAEISAPEVDAQLERARAAAREAEANVKKAEVDQELGESTLQRYHSIDPKAITQQQLDEVTAQSRRAITSVDVARATLASSQAEVRQLEALQGFQKVVAPFAGVITARNRDVGALVSSSSSADGSELFQIDQVDVLRVFVKIPQDYATSARPGQRAELTVVNYPGRTFEGTIVRSAGSLDPDTRTLRIEVDVPNKEDLLLPGMFGQVTLEVTRDQPVMLVPTSAVIYDASGLRVATVRDGKIRLQRVSAGHDMGIEIEILEGLTGTESVVANPGGRLEDGMEVKATAAAAPATSKPAQRGS